MVLSSTENPDLLLLVGRHESIAAEDIDDLILEINKNKAVVKSLVLAKTRLIRDINSTMQQRAKRGDMFCKAQMLEYREFSEFFEAESAILSSYMARLEKKTAAGQSCLRQEVLKKRADLPTIHKGLEAIVTLQVRAIAVLSGMVDMAGRTLDALTK